MAKWMMAAKKADFTAWGEALAVDPVIARIIRNRDITTIEEAKQFLHADLSSLHAPELLCGMKQAVELLSQKIEAGVKLRVIGDYDIDGVCSTYLLKTGLQQLGAKVDAAIPHRQKDGYGLSDGLIDSAAADGIDTIVTCDNGIAAAPQIEQASKLGMTVVVTDHHEVPFAGETDGARRELLPGAAVIIDPKQAACSYPFSGICGAVVAYKLAQALFAHYGRELPEEFLEFAAIATVGDVMELRDENRVIVKYGLRLLQHTKHQGLRALMEVSGLGDKTLSPYHIGFILGPCLNAGGRLDTAQRALELLEEKDKRKALRLAGELKKLNDSRKDMTAQGVREACRILESADGGAQHAAEAGEQAAEAGEQAAEAGKQAAEAGKQAAEAGKQKVQSAAQRDRVLVVFLPDCHESLAGIIAGRLREKYGKPVFVFTRSQEGIKGSGRSIEAFHMYEHLSRCKELFTKFGGHKLAAGLSMPEENLELFCRKINEDCGLSEADFEETVHIDVPMPMSYVSEELIRQFSCLEPFGMGNPKPLFAQKNVLFLSGRLMGRNANVGKYAVSDETGARYEMIYFGDLERFHACIAGRYGADAVEKLYAGRGEEANVRLTVAYYPDINEFKGRISIQYVLQHYC